MQAILNERESLLNEAVVQLPLKQRVVIHLHYYEDYSIKEIADILRPYRKQRQNAAYAGGVRI